MLSSERPPNFLRFAHKVTGQKKQKIRKYLDKLYDMGTNFVYYARKIRDCSKRYSNAPYVVWAAVVYNMSYRSVVLKGLDLRFETSPKQVVQAQGLDYIIERIDEPVKELSSDGHLDIRKCKAALLRKGYYYSTRGIVYLVDKKPVVVLPQNFNVSKAVKEMVVPIGVLRDLELLWYGKMTACTYEDRIGGGVVYDDESLKIFEHTLISHHFSDLDFKIGGFEYMPQSYIDQYHVMILSCELKIQFGKTIGNCNKVIVSIYRDSEQGYEVQYGPYYTHIKKREGFKRVVLDMYRQREVVIDIPIYSDHSRTGKYHVSVHNSNGTPIKNSVIVHERYYLTITTRCIDRMNDFRHYCSCGGKRYGPVICSEQGKCVPYSSKEQCGDCKISDFRFLMDQMSSIRNANDVRRVLWKRKQFFLDKDIKYYDEYMNKVREIRNYVTDLNQKYNAMFTFDLETPWELVATFDSLFYLEEPDYIQFMTMYEKIFSPAQICRFTGLNMLEVRRRWMVLPNVFDVKSFNCDNLYLWEANNKK